MNISGFEWDDGNTGHCQKHGVTLVEIEQVFMSGARVFGDPFEAERRFRAIGCNNAGRFVYVVFMFKERHDAVFIRPISARYMHRREIERYDET